MGGGGGGRRALAKVEGHIGAQGPGVKGTKPGISLPGTQGAEPGPYIPKKFRVEITRPNDKDIVFGIIEVRVVVYGGREKIKASLLLNGTSIGEIGGRKGSIQYDTTKKPNRNYRLTAKAFDAEGNKDEKSIQIVIKNLIH